MTNRNSIMYIQSLVVTLISVIAATMLAPTDAARTPLLPYRPEQQAEPSLGRRASVFIENRGQWDRRVKYMLSVNGLDMWITNSGVVYDLYRLQSIDPVQTKEGSSLSSSEHDPFTSKMDGHMTRSGHVVRVSFDGAAFAPTAHGGERQPGYYNYIIGNDPTKWASSVPLYGSARLGNIYSGIDALFYLDNGKPRYDFVVAPGADPEQVRLRIEGADALSVTETGSLAIGTSMGVLEQRELYAYQEVNGVRQKIACRFAVTGEQRVSFELGSYDRTRPLVIDPLVYSTFLGGTREDFANALSVDAGNVYVAGYTPSNDFPTTSGAYTDTHHNIAEKNLDGFVTKMNASGSALIYSTFIGGDVHEFVNGIATDSRGRVYIIGNTNSSNYPTTSGAFRGTYAGKDIFITKLNDSGTGIIYSTFLGGTSTSDEDQGYGIAVDSSGNACVTGFTESLDFPTTSGAFSTTYHGSNLHKDAFVAKLNASGTALLYSTLLGGVIDDVGYRIVVDAAGIVYVTGSTNSSDFPTTSGAFSTMYHDSVTYATSDAFVTKVSADGKAIIYSTFIGGTGREGGDAYGGTGISVDHSGNVYIAGSTTSTDFPTTSGAFNTIYHGSNLRSDAFVTKLNSSGTALLYSTLLGGAGDDKVNAITIDTVGNIYLTGFTSSGDFPTTSDTYLSANHAAEDLFVTKLNASGTALIYSTMMGGKTNDEGHGIAADTSGNIYVAGNTDSDNFPSTSGVFDETYNTGGQGVDGVVVKLSVPPVIGHASVQSPLEPQIHLGAVIPNPAHSTASIEFTLPHQEHIRLTIVDPLGRSVSSVADEVMTSGRHVIAVNVAAFASGNYFCRLVTPEGVCTQMLQIVK